MSKTSWDDSQKTKKLKGFHDVFDQLHDQPVCSIPPTTGKKKYVDMMDVYRPTRKDMIRIKDYNLTQAYTVMDRDPVKIHIRDTDCQYKFHPPGHDADMKGPVACAHGPIDKFLMEEFVDVIEYYQEFAHKVLKQKIKDRLRKEKADKIKLRGTFDRLLGPDWFQELSNLQYAAVESLAKAILLDLAQNSIENTQFAIAKLGLVLRPNHVLIKRALQMCASCPVEFLLVLYQLINPERTSYSINDRLLLSAVVHLTIRSTLKELHVRIPSPPRASPKKLRPKEQPKKTPKSPYLQDLLLRDKIKYPSFCTPNKYYSKHDYFNYVEQMRLNRIQLKDEWVFDDDSYRDFQYGKIFTGGVCTCDNCPFPDCTALKDLDEFTRIEIDLITEWTKAQKYYTSLVKTPCITALFKPSVYVCPIGKFRPHPENLSIKKSITSNTPEEESSTGFAETLTPKKCACKSQPTSQSELTNSKAVGVSVTFTDQEPECICSIGYSDEYGQNEEEEYISTERTVTPVPHAERDLMMGHLLSVKTVESETCACKEAILKRIDESLCHCDRCVDDRRRQNSIVTYIIADTKETEDKPVPILKDCIAKPICTCMEKYQKRWAQFEQTRGVRKVQEALKSLDEKFVINGTAIGPDGKIVYILSSVLPKRCCQCARLKEMEEEEKRTLKQMPMLPGGCIKYHITGVQERPEGNVYIVGGTTENTECDCMALYDRFTREHSICMKLYNEYMKKIAYDTEEYLKEVDTQYCDFEPSAAWTGSEVDVVEKSCTCHCDRATQMCCCYCSCNAEPSVECICSVQSCPCGFGECECVTEEEGVDEFDGSLYEGEGECICTPSSEVSKQEDPSTANCACSTFTNKECSKDSKDSKETDASSKRKPVLKNDSADKLNVRNAEQLDDIIASIREEYMKHPLYKIEDPPELERYMIFKELPKTNHEQTEVLKKALVKLGEDGFPLARLPDVHNLPIFKAWWRFRLKKYYTAKKRDTMLNLKDKILLQRMDRARPWPPNMKFSFLRDSKELHDWDHHSLIKTQNMADRANYIRCDKAISINYARELYTLMRQYEFNNKTFNDVFFAYMPSKEEDTFVDRIWKSNEYRKVHPK